MISTKDYLAALRRVTIITVLAAGIAFMLLWTFAAPDPACRDEQVPVLGSRAWVCVVGTQPDRR